MTATSPDRSSVLTIPVTVDFGHFGCVRLDMSPCRVTSSVAPSRVMGDHQQLLLAVGGHRALRRNHLDARHRRIVVVAVGHALHDPAAHQPVSVRVDFHPRAAAVRGCANRLQQQQAPVRRGGKQPSAATFFHQMFEVFSRLEPQQRQLEAVLPAGLAVAAAAVAAQLGEDRHDLVGKVDRRLRCPDWPP